MDMVGRLHEDKDTQKLKIEIGGTGTAKQFDALVDKLASKYELELKKAPGGTGPSDHQSFFMKKLPVLFLFTGIHPDYHRPSDTWDKINYDGMARIVDMTEDLTTEVATMNPKPDFVNDTTAFAMLGSTGRSRGPRLGVMPDYNYVGEGMRIEGASPGGPAEKGGLKEGDRIIEIGGKPVKNVATYMDVMAKMKPGQEIEIIVLRGKDGKDEKLTLKVTPAGARQ
jgi:C-terminal processing protease CtpA/Prc